MEEDTSNFFKVKITGVCAFLIKWNKKFQLHIWDRKVISFIIVLTFFFINYSYIYIYILASKLIKTIKPYPSAHIFVQQPPQLNVASKDLIIIWSVTQVFTVRAEPEAHYWQGINKYILIEWKYKPSLKINSARGGPHFISCFLTFKKNKINLV